MLVLSYISEIHFFSFNYLTAKIGQFSEDTGTLPPSHIQSHWQFSPVIVDQVKLVKLVRKLVSCNLTPNHDESVIVNNRVGVGQVFWEIRPLFPSKGVQIQALHVTGMNFYIIQGVKKKYFLNNFI